MHTRILSTRAHGIIGSLAITAAAAAPALLKLENVPSSAKPLRLWAAGAVGVVALTDFELGLVRVLPMPAHLAIDAVAGPALAVSPWLTGAARRGWRYWLPHALVGGTEFLLALLTRTQPSYREGGQSKAKPVPIPRDETFDSTLALLSEGYTFVSTRCQRYRSDLFQTRLMLTKAVCMLGAEAAAEFYTPDRFTRKRAIPITALKLLQDKGSVQLLDGAAHRWRKQMFLSLMTPAHIEQLVELTTTHWRAALQRWTSMPQVVLDDAVPEILCRAVCQWAGVPLPEAEVHQRTRELAAMFKEAGAVGPRNWRAQFLRVRAERWIHGVIQRVRAGTLTLPETSAAHVIAWHRDPDGKLLEPAVATVELLNVLRPTVAVARFVTFIALALYEHPQYRQRLQAGNDEELEWFVQEVRRFYPFFPLVGGRVQREFEWRGYHFTRGTWVLLDLYGTNHDSRSWDDPHTFRPERFRTWDGNAFRLVPQGGGDRATGHRCPGEELTIALMQRATLLLTTAMQYDVPAQDLRIDLTRMPAVPKSGFVISNVRTTH